MSRVRTSLEDALIPLAEPPEGPGWNHAAVADWLADTPRLPAAVLIGLRDDGERNIIFTRRQDKLAQHAGQVSFPGGGMEPGDADMVATALRETEEEVGLPRDVVTPLGFLDCFETISGFCVTPVVARIAHDAPALVPNAAEVAEVFEVPLAFFLAPDNARRYTMAYRGQQRPMVEFRFGGFRIWGATASMLFNLLGRMGLT